ncbi:amidase [Burkholderia lata]|uniref:Amidase n=1 Tax=Burkholderia lata (strain ATCC 17760 / DSM 23089 / LMG 22485 / NCIMB 9086 / R18194 / 383) TaxID=482957 RepID=A0A6P2TGZ4_BURL3|nr:amidase family protein [Burkholderia lata]VWC56922.1 amidase [Burkholderia lata]
MNIDEYVRHDATGLADEIRAGRVSADDVMRAAKAAVARVNPELNAIIETFDAPLEYAADGPFAGVPFLIKDLVLHANGIANDSGSRLLAGRYESPADSELMARFRRAGFATFGRTTTPEFGFNATTESVLHGPTRNPWNPAYSAGGSSGGSAAAVAAGIVPAAHANDGGGSIRIPAAACGLVGLKPSRGRTPVGPDYNLPLFGLGIEFAVTRTVRDSAAILDAVEGPEPGAMFDIGRPPVRYADAIRTPARRLRVAVATRFPGTGVTHPDCVAAAEQVARTLEQLGHDVDVAMPAYDAEALASANCTAWTAFLASVALGAAETLGRPYDPRDVEACTHACIEHGRALSGLDLQRMLMQFNGVSRAVGSFFGGYDLLVTPVMRMPTVELGYLDQNDATLDARGWCDKVFDYCPFTGLFNVTGTPAISLPAGWSGDRPVGVQLAGPMGSEAVLLQVAAALEQTIGWHTRRPRVHAAAG